MDRVRRRTWAGIVGSKRTGRAIRPSRSIRPVPRASWFAEDPPLARPLDDVQPYARFASPPVSVVASLGSSCASNECASNSQPSASTLGPLRSHEGGAGGTLVPSWMPIRTVRLALLAMFTGACPAPFGFLGSTLDFPTSGRLALPPAAYVPARLCETSNAEALPPLSLARVASWALPEEYQASGVAVSSDAKQLMVWTSRSSQILIRKEFREYEVTLVGLQGFLAAAFEDDTLIQVVDPYGKRIIRVSTRGTRLASWPLQGYRVLAAHRGEDTWFVALQESREDTVPIIVEVAPGVAREHHLPDSVGVSVRDVIHLTAHGGGVFVSTSRPPFRIVFVPGEPRTASDIRAIRDIELDSTRSWVALPILPLDRAYVQTIADLGSDRRLIRLIDCRGAEARTLELDAPIGFVASVPRHRILVSVDAVEGVQVAVYEWRWTR